MATIIDLTLEMYHGFRSHPAHHPQLAVIDYVTHEQSAPRYKPPCQGYASKLIVISDHAGTHVDAPYHFCPDKGTVECIPLTRLVGPAILVDVSDKDPDAPITVELLQGALDKQGIELKPGLIVIIHAWKGEWGSEGFFHARSLTGNAAEWLLDRRVRAVGIDLSVIDDPKDETRPGHRLFLNAGIPVLENLTNLAQIGVSRFYFVAVPLKIRGLTGSPVRAFAILTQG